MAKPFELIYSTQKTGFETGRAYSNPRLFSSPRADATKVYVVGKWPAVAAAYRAKGVEVVECEPHQIGAILRGHPPAQFVATPHAPAPPVDGLVSDVPPADRASVEIPEDWRDLPWRPDEAGGATIRALATKFSDAPILNKALAVAAITAEWARRAAVQASAESGQSEDAEGFQ